MGFKKLLVLPLAFLASHAYCHTSGSGGLVQALQPDTATANQNAATSINVLANDVVSAAGGNVMTIATNPAHGTATVNDNGTPAIADDTIIYVPTANYTGADSFSYTVTDGVGAAQTVTVSITVNAVALSIATNIVHESCPGASDGAIFAYGKNGVFPYTFFNLAGPVTATNTTGEFLNLPPGTYTLTLTDSSGAIATRPNLIVNAASDLIVTSDTTICAGNPKQLSVTGGGTYAWTASPADPTLTAPTSSNPTVSPTQTTTYTVTSTIPLDRNLIRNGDFVQGNNAFYSDYTFVGNILTSTPSNYPRHYGTSASPQQWSSVFPNCGDHTTGNGTMMIVSGSHVNGGNDRVWQQTVNVTPGQNYLFKYWVQNLSATNAASFIVKINGVQVGGSNAADPSNACNTWVEHTYAWPSGTATTATIALYDQTTSINGNDFALDDFSMKRTGETCTMTKSVTISTVNQLEAAIDGPLGAICPGYTVDLVFTGTPFTTVTFTSTSGNGSVVLDQDGTATYSPFIVDTTTFNLGTATNGACSNPVTGSFTVYVLPTSAAPCTSEQPFPYPTASVQIATPIPVCNAGDTTVLRADYFVPKPPTSYLAKVIPYQNLFSYTGGQLLNANCDDVFAAPYTIPFNFCFYNNFYDDVLIGSNGVISFDMNFPVQGCAPLQYCPWAFSTPIPNAGFPIKNAIYGVYQDTYIDPSGIQDPAVQNVNYYAGGVAPNRYFVVNFNELPQYLPPTPGGLQTSQIILHETTNIVDVYVKRRVPNMGWQGGVGVIGVQNAAGTLATAAPGRNTGSWSVTNEAYRFYPNGNGNPLAIVEWKDAAGNVISNENSIEVTVTGPATYSVTVTYLKCDGTQATTDPATITLDVEPPLGITAASDITICGQSGGPFVFPDINQNSTILAGLTATNFDVSYYETREDAENWAGNNITNLQNYTVANASDLPKTIYVRVTDILGSAGCANYTEFVLDAFSPGGSIAYPQPSYNVTVPNTSATPAQTSDLEPGGTYTADIAGILLDPGTGTVNVSGSSPGTYEITYTVTAPGCTPYATSTTLILDSSCTVTAGISQAEICTDVTSINLTATGTETNAT